MKTRHTLVSNSSSSSFILLGHKIPIGDVKLGGTNNYWALGKQLKHAIDLVKISDDKFVDFITAFSHMFEVYIAEATFDIKINLPPLVPPNIRLDGVCDNKSSSDLKRLLKNYRSDIGEEVYNKLKEKYGVVIDEDTTVTSK